MNRFWSVLFLLVPVLGIASVLMAMYGVAPLESAWLPKSLSQAGDTIDQLFNGIHLLSAFILAGTVFTIGWALWRFSDRGDSNEKALYVTHNTKLEITWTVIPAARIGSRSLSNSLYSASVPLPIAQSPLMIK